MEMWMDIQGHVFKNLYSDALYWGPGQLGQPSVSMQLFEVTEGTLPFNITQFPIFVTNTQCFTSNFEELTNTREIHKKPKILPK